MTFFGLFALDTSIYGKKSKDIQKLLCFCFRQGFSPNPWYTLMVWIQKAAWKFSNNNNIGTEKNGKQWELGRGKKKISKSHRRWKSVELYEGRFLKQKFLEDKQKLTSPYNFGQFHQLFSQFHSDKKAQNQNVCAKKVSRDMFFFNMC